MSSGSVSIVVTDLDNTLWDWVDIWHKSFSAMLGELERTSGIDRAELITGFKEVFTRHGTTEYAFALEEHPALIRKHPDGNIVEIYSSAIDSFRKGRASALNLYASVLDTLMELKRNGVLIVAYTESLSFYSRYRLIKLGLDEVIDYLYSPPDHELPPDVSRNEIRIYPKDKYELKKTVHRFLRKGDKKPSPHVLSQILTDIRVRPEQAIYIGDSLLKDVSMAQVAGVRDVWAKYGESHRVNVLSQSTERPGVKF